MGEMADLINDENVAQDYSECLADRNEPFYYASLKELLGQTVTVLARNVTLKGVLKRNPTHPTSLMVSNDTGCFAFYEGDVKWIDDNKGKTPIVVIVGA